MSFNPIYALIAEGKAERVILNILLDNNLLIFSRDEILEREVITIRSCKRFEEKHLKFKMGRRLEVYRVLDSTNGKFKLKYKDAVVHDILTRPEIEVLILIDKGLYKNYQKVKQTQKASEYLASKIDYHKGEKWWTNYYANNPQKLVNNIKEYHRLRPDKKQNSILDIMKL